MLQEGVIKRQFNQLSLMPYVFFSLFAWTVCNLRAADSWVKYFRCINFIIKFRSNDLISEYKRSIKFSSYKSTKLHIHQSYWILKCFNDPLLPCSFLDFSEDIFWLGKKFQEIFSEIVPLYNNTKSHLLHWQPSCSHMFPGKFI